MLAGMVDKFKPGYNQTRQALRGLSQPAWQQEMASYQLQAAPVAVVLLAHLILQL